PSTCLRSRILLPLRRPLSIIFPTRRSSDLNAPAGYINVKSIYGTGRSKFRYYDTRNILFDWGGSHGGMAIAHGWRDGSKVLREADRKSTRLNSSHVSISYAVFGLKQKIITT